MIREKGVAYMGIGKASGSDLTQSEVQNAAETIHKSINSKANMIFGTVINEELQDSILITIITTGCDIA